MSKRVLIVDDSPFIVQVLGRALRNAGYETEVARDLSDFEGPRTQPDLVLMDVVLQEAFGDDLVMLLRADGKFTCPIVLISSLPDDELEQRSKDAGADDFISKARGLPAIVAKVRAIIGDALAAPIEAGFELDARQRVRRVRHVMARADRWNATAIIGELQALAGDADVAQAPAVAAAARACSAAVRTGGSAGSTPEIREKIDALAKTVSDSASQVRNVLVLDDGEFCRTHLLARLDHAGYAVLEARTLAEARQKLRAADYDLVIAHSGFRAKDPSLLSEIAAALPDVPRVIVDESVDLDAVVRF